MVPKESRGGKRPGAGRPAEKSQIALRGGNEPPEKPIGLKEHASELWDLAIESLPHVLRKVDGPVLRLCCDAYQSAMDARSILDKDPTDHKAHARFISAITKFDGLAKGLGLNPHSRRVIKPADGEQGGKKTDDAFENWLKRGGLN